jgi:hypothetical protein
MQAEASQRESGFAFSGIEPKSSQWLVEVDEAAAPSVHGIRQQERVALTETFAFIPIQARATWVLNEVNFKIDLHPSRRKNLAIARELEKEVRISSRRAP